MSAPDNLVFRFRRLHPGRDRHDRGRAGRPPRRDPAGRRGGEPRSRRAVGAGAGGLSYYCNLVKDLCSDLREFDLKIEVMHNQLKDTVRRHG